MVSYFIARKDFLNFEDWEIHERCSSYLDARRRLKEYRMDERKKKVTDIRRWVILDIYNGKILVID